MKRPRSSHSTDTSASKPGVSALMRSASPSIWAGCTVAIGTTSSSGIPSAIIELMACVRLKARLATERMILVVVMLGRRVCRSRNFGVVAVHVGAERVRHDTGGERLACDPVREMAAMADVDPESAVERSADHAVNFAPPINEAARMTRKRVSQNIAGTKHRDDLLHDRVGVLAVGAALGQSPERAEMH